MIGYPPLSETTSYYTLASIKNSGLNKTDMKKIICLIVITLTSLPFYVFSQQPPKNNALINNQISIGNIDSLYSETLKEQRELWIHVPKIESKDQKFPVLILLDAEWNFHAIVAIMKSFVLNGLCPEMIIVGIPNTNRYRDLSTSHVGDDTNPSGGAEDFTNFLAKELLPHLDANYPATSYRTFVGHSLGGLVVVNTLMKHPHLFNNYLAIDPSLGWDNQKLLNEAKSLINQNAFENKSLYVSIANTLRNNMSYEEALTDTSSATLHLRSIVEFSKLAESHTTLLSDWKYHKNQSHGTLPIIAEHNAFQFLFSWYKFEHWDEFYSPEPKLSGNELVQLIENHYKNISDKLMQIVKPKETEINRLGYMFLKKEDHERALPFFELNIKNHPESANAYDCMGDYYNSLSDKPNSIKYFKKAIELGGVDNTKEKLEGLIKGK